MFNSYHKTAITQLEYVSGHNKIYPSLEDLAVGFSFVLHAKIIEDFESKGSSHSPKNETFFNRNHLLSYLSSDLKDIPSANEIFSFTFNLYSSLGPSEECLMLTLMYVLRVLKTSEIKIFAGNWQIIIIGATLTSLRVCDPAHYCNLQLKNLLVVLSHDEIFELNDEFSCLMESKYEVDLSFFGRCLDILAYAWEEQSEKKWKLNLEKVSKIISRSKTFDNAEEDEEDSQRIIKSERLYSINLDQFELDY